MATPAPSQPKPATSEERAALYKTLTNPVRRRILDYIGQHREANSTSVAAALGESTGTTSYHLRKLAEQGLIQEIPERSAGRERWWRVLPFDHVTAAPGDRTPDEDAALQEWSSQRLSADIELYIKALAEYEGPEGWVQAHRHNGVHMTRAELLAFYGEYLALVAKYGHPPEDASDDTRPFALRFLAVPDPGTSRGSKPQQNA